jgi:hypothetical protein
MIAHILSALKLWVQMMETLIEDKYKPLCDLDECTGDFHKHSLKEKI